MLLIYHLAAVYAVANFYRIPYFYRVYRLYTCMHMKRIVQVIAALVVGIVLLGIVYPQQPKLALSFQVSTTPAITLQYLADQKLWSQWWPKQTAANSFLNQPLQVQAANLPMAVLQTRFKNTPLQWQVQLFNKWVDTTILQLFITPTKPIWGWEKIQFYWHNKTVQLEAAKLFTALASYIGNEQNMYGFTVQMGKMTDTVLVSNTRFYNQWPTTQNIGEQVTTLRNYLSSIGTKETNYPMLNVVQVDGKYKCKIALPTDTVPIPPPGIEIKNMVLGGTLRATVKGGNYTLQNAMKKYHQYLTDKGLTSPAIPYESMVTDRWKEPDTSKWTTILYYPIM